MIANLGNTLMFRDHDFLGIRLVQLSQIEFTGRESDSFYIKMSELLRVGKKKPVCL